MGKKKLGPPVLLVKPVVLTCVGCIKHILFGKRQVCSSGKSTNHAAGRIIDIIIRTLYNTIIRTGTYCSEGKGEQRALTVG